ncbi:MAG TPA: hypothetical protein VHO24_18145, partial [Opitutaceae bacterium]|nr:hypothetical protein [Opitutaceae bacterium]
MSVFWRTIAGLALNTRIYRRAARPLFFGRIVSLESGALGEASVERHLALHRTALSRCSPEFSNVMLCSLRSLLHFVQLQGACAASKRNDAFSPAPFSSTNPRGRRDYAIALYLLDLGLQAEKATATAAFPRDVGAADSGGAGDQNGSSPATIFGAIGTPREQISSRKTCKSTFVPTGRRPQSGQRSTRS